MKKIRLLIIVDIVALLSLLVSFISGLIIEEFFETSGVKLLGFGRGYWGEFHVASSWFFIIMVAIHLVLHFGWIKAIPKLWKN